MQQKATSVVSRFSYLLHQPQIIFSPNPVAIYDYICIYGFSHNFPKMDKIGINKNYKTMIVLNTIFLIKKKKKIRKKQELELDTDTLFLKTEPRIRIKNKTKRNTENIFIPSNHFNLMAICCYFIWVLWGLGNSNDLMFLLQG